jgi:hypothetical protein
MAQLCLTVLPYKLRLARLLKSDLPLACHSLLGLLTSPPGEVKFFSFTESNDDSISLILTSSALRRLDPARVPVTVAPERWRAVLVSEGVATGGGIISLVSEVCSRKGHSILYVSGSVTDYVLVMEHGTILAIICCCRQVLLSPSTVQSVWLRIWRGYASLGNIAASCQGRTQ